MSLLTRAKGLVGLYNGMDPKSSSYSMLARVHPGTGSMPSFGTIEMLHAATRQPWLMAITGKVGFSVAAVQWKLYAVRGYNGKAVRGAYVRRIQKQLDQKLRRNLLKQVAADALTLVEITDHPFLTAFNYGNSYMSGNALRRLTSIYHDTVGESFWMKERKTPTGPPIAFWPIPPHWIRLTPIPTRKSYLVSFRGWQGEIPDTEIFWQANLDPEFPYGRGRGIAQALVDELEIDYWGGRFIKSWFYNGARPDLIISTEGLNPADTSRMEAEWMSKNQGFWNAFKPYFLNKKVDITKIDTSFRNMQLVQLRQAERDTIVQVFGVPPELMGILEHSNRATIVVAKQLYSEQTLIPRLEFQRDNMQSGLIPEWDEDVILDYESPTEEDREFNLEVMKANAAAFTVDDWRDTGGRGPLDGGTGNTLLIPTTVLPTDPSTLPFETPASAPTIPAGDVTEAGGAISAAAQLPRLKAGNEGNAAALASWYESGADGAIDWGSAGDFEQCVAVAEQYLDNAEGYCQERHIAATGMTTSEHAHEDG